MDWDQIKKAIEQINKDGVKRVDGDGWTVYAVGSSIIRVDIKVKH